MADVMLDRYERGLAQFGHRLHQVRSDQWSLATPCSDWDVRALVDHVAVEQLWVPALLAGQTVADVGDRFEGDQLGADPVGTWDRAAAAAGQAFGAPGALDRTVHLSYGDSPVRHYCREMTFDLVVHAWDLAMAAGLDTRLDPDLVADADEFASGRLDGWRGDIFAPAQPV